MSNRINAPVGTIQPESPNRRGTLNKLLLAAALTCVFAVAGQSATTAFTFQGRLNDSGTPANGNYDLQLKLFTTAAVGSGTQIGATISRSTVKVTDGVFTVELDFTAAAFPGADRFLEIGIKPAGSGGAFTVLQPRQPITPTPYALYSDNAATANHASTATNSTNSTNATNATNATTATNATKLNNVAASQYVLTSDPRLTNARPPTAGSSAYIHNSFTLNAPAATPTPQPNTDFNISGNGQMHSLYISTTAGIAVDAETKSGGEAVYAACLQSGNNCYALEGYAPTGDYAGYMYGGKGVYVESDDASQPALQANAFGGSAYAVSGESQVYRAGYFKSGSNANYSLFVDSKDGPTQAVAALDVRGTILGEGDLIIYGSKAGYVVDIMQSVDNAPLEPGDVVVIAGSSAPVLGEIPVVTVKKATSSNDPGVVGIVDKVWFAPNPETKTAYEAQENAVRAAMSSRKTATIESRATGAKVVHAPMPETKITDEQGTLHAMPNAASAGPGGYVSVVTLGSFKMVKVDASFGAIKPGDPLSTSTTPGYAMKAAPVVISGVEIYRPGTILGKALEPFDQGSGFIKVFVSLK